MVKPVRHANLGKAVKSITRAVAISRISNCTVIRMHAPVCSIRCTVHGAVSC